METIDIYTISKYELGDCYIYENKLYKVVGFKPAYGQTTGDFIVISPVKSPKTAVEKHLKNILVEKNAILIIPNGKWSYMYVSCIVVKKDNESNLTFTPIKYKTAQKIAKVLRWTNIPDWAAHNYDIYQLQHYQCYSL